MARQHLQQPPAKGVKVTDRGVDPSEEFAEFARAQAGQLFRIAFMMCNDWHGAEDLVQVTLVKVYVAWGRLRRDSNADRYARTVLLNTFLSQRRLKRSGEIPTAEIRDLPTPGVDADLRMTLLTALRRLPPRTRAVLVLRYVEDHSIESVAALMGTTRAAIKSRNARGLAQLRELLGADQDVLRS
jgi:RNA polymerase sigma-70 factor (sigma-E family)